MAKAAKVGKRAKKPDTRPARARYWAEKHLQKNKIRHIMKNSNMTEAQAFNHWMSARKGRMKTA